MSNNNEIIRLSSGRPVSFRSPKLDTNYTYTAQGDNTCMTCMYVLTIVPQLSYSLVRSIALCKTDQRGEVIFIIRPKKKSNLYAETVEVDLQG